MLLRRSLFDSAVRDDIHGYFALTKFLREIAREHLDSTLQGAIYGKAGQSNPCKAARQVHDATAIGDDRQKLLRQQEHALEMNARVVDESVECSRVRA